MLTPFGQKNGFMGDHLRSAGMLAQNYGTSPPQPGEPGGFGGYVVGEMLAGYIGLGGHPAGASYKILSLIGHGAKSIVYPLVISRYGSSQLLRVVFDSDYK